MLSNEICVEIYVVHSNQDYETKLKWEKKREKKINMLIIIIQIAWSDQIRLTVTYYYIKWFDDTIRVRFVYWYDHNLFAYVTNC